MAVMGIDVGSSGCKSLVFADDGSILASTYKEYEHLDNVYEIDARNVWDCARFVIDSSVKKAGVKINVLAVSSFGEAFVPIDDKGRVICRSMLYTDPRGIQQCAALANKFGRENIMKITGVNPHHMFALPKIMWFRQNMPQQFKAAKTYLFMADFIIYRLTGEKCVDYSLASRSMAFDIFKKTWRRDYLNEAGIDETYLPAPVPAGYAAGTVLPAMSQELGLSADTIVVPGGQDQVCAAIGAGVTQPGVAVDSTGTVECITPAFDHPIIREEFFRNNYACVPYAIPEMYVTYAFNFTGGSLLKWYRNNFALHLEGEASKQGISIYQLLDKTAADKPSDVMVIPHFSGSGTPDMRAEVSGSFFGLRFDTQPPDIYRGLLEGVTYEMKYNIDRLLENGIAINSLKAAGGGASSPLWLQIKADIMGLDIVPLETMELGAVGAAILAAVEGGIHPDLETAVKHFSRAKATVHPNAANHKIYRERYEKYKIARQCSMQLTIDNSHH